VADYLSEDIRLQAEETDEYAWVSLEEARNYNLIDGIFDELAMTDKLKQDRSKRNERQRAD